MTGGDTIVALASPLGFAPRALVRLSGPDAAGALARLTGLPAPSCRSLFSTRLRLSPPSAPPVELPCLAAFFRAPASFTGEDVAEVFFPSSPPLIDRVLRAITAQPGVRPARPGEFSARAYLNGRMSIAQTEGIAAAIAARTEEELAAARDLLRNEDPARDLADEIARLLALVEAGIDFQDQEDVTPISPEALAKSLDALIAAIAHRSGRAAPRAGSHAPRIVLAGTPNAGKSTLFNALLGRERAIASPAAGTTRDALAEPLRLGPLVIELIDLPGLDEACADAPSRAAHEAALHHLRHADVIVHCDPTGAFRPFEQAPAGVPRLLVRTMADLPAPAPSAAIPLCALDGWNLTALRDAIADAALGARSSAPALVIPRHAAALTAALRHLTEARALAAADPALLAAALRSALDALDEIAGRIPPDEVLGRIFATFCIGK